MLVTVMVVLAAEPFVESDGEKSRFIHLSAKTRVFSTSEV